jgi:hypothetical protein
MDTFFATKKAGKSSQGHACCQRFVTDKGFVYVVPMKSKRYLGGATTPRRTLLPLVDGIASLTGPADLINDLLSLFPMKSKSELL